MNPEVEQAYKRAVEGAKLAVEFSANDVNARAIPLTPMLTGHLRGSAVTEVVEDDAREFRMEVSFNTPYAAAQHEGGWVTGPNAGVRIKNYTTPGTGPKYLESPLKAMLPRYRDVIGKSVAVALRGSGARVR